MACPYCDYDNPQFFFEGDMLPENLDCAVCGQTYGVVEWEFDEGTEKE